MDFYPVSSISKKRYYCEEDLKLVASPYSNNNVATTNEELSIQNELDYYELNLISNLRSDYYQY